MNKVHLSKPTLSSDKITPCYICGFQGKAHFKTHLNSTFSNLCYSIIFVEFKPEKNLRYLPNYDKILIFGQITQTRGTSNN